MTAKKRQIQEALALLEQFSVKERENYLERLRSIVPQKPAESARNKGEIV